uniref:Uncharacterized protein n=1 Tax=Glossina austeni TaxID=7395 RepID=A0A1A9UQT0_GLOAU
MSVALDNADWPPSSISSLDEVISSPSCISSAPSGFVSEDSSPISPGSSSGSVMSISSWEDDTYNVEPSSTSIIDPALLSPDIIATDVTSSASCLNISISEEATFEIVGIKGVVALLMSCCNMQYVMF